MGISIKLKNLLTESKVKFDSFQHTPAFSAQEIAGAQHVAGKDAIKSVIVKVDDRYVMCVLPAVHLVDLPKLKSVIKAKNVQLANEDDLAKLFPDYELGAEPPFGNLYGLEVYADDVLEDNDFVVFNAGTHTDTVRIKYSDFVRLAKPRVASFGKHV